MMQMTIWQATGLVADGRDAGPGRTVGRHQARGRM